MAFVCRGALPRRPRDTARARCASTNGPPVCAAAQPTAASAAGAAAAAAAATAAPAPRSRRRRAATALPQRAVQQQKHAQLPTQQQHQLQHQQQQQQQQQQQLQQKVAPRIGGASAAGSAGIARRVRTRSFVDALRCVGGGASPPVRALVRNGPAAAAVGPPRSSIATHPVAVPATLTRTQQEQQQKQELCSLYGPSPTTTDIGTPRRMDRKPNGYWNELANVETALIEVNRLIPGRQGKRIMPTTAEMRALGRGDLLAALAKHSGLKVVAASLGWSCKRSRAAGASSTADALTTNATDKKHTAHLQSLFSSSTSRSASSPSSSSSSFSSYLSSSLSAVASTSTLHPALLTEGSALQPSPPVRAKVPRRPKDCWSDFNHLASCIGAFIAEFGTPGIMPLTSDFDRNGKSDLRQATRRHGGFYAVARRMGLRCRPPRKKDNAWDEFDYFSVQLLGFAEQHDPGVMPTATELASAGATGLSNAVSKHGGFPAVARRLGLIVRSTSEGAPEIWDVQRLGDQLRTFTATFYPTLAFGNHLPSETQLRRCGRNDLSYAISKFGGYKRVQELLGFESRPVGARTSSRHDPMAAVAALEGLGQD